MNIIFFFAISDIVELLLSYEASCNSADDKGSSPLHLAAWAGNKDIVDMLLTKGPSIANVNLTVSLTMHMLLHVLSILFCYRKYTRCLVKNLMFKKQSTYNLVNIIMCCRYWILRTLLFSRIESVHLYFRFHCITIIG